VKSSSSRQIAMTFRQLSSLTLIAVSACAAPAPSEEDKLACVGKCDASSSRMLASLELNDVRTTDDHESFRMVGMIADAHHDEVAEGDELNVELRLADGDADPSYRIDATLTYDMESLDGFISTHIDASGFLPWRYMMAHVTGTLTGGMVVDEHYVFAQGTLAGEPADAGWAPSPIGKPGAHRVAFHPGPPSQEVRFWADLDHSIAPTDLVHDGDTLALELRLADGDADPTFAIEATLTYDADAADAFVTGAVDISEFLPWQQITARVTGTLGGDIHVDRTFSIRADALGGL